MHFMMFQQNRDKIESFIDENKALMKRMYGYFEAENEYGSQLQQGKKRKRMLYGDDFNPPNLPDLEELYGPPGDGPDPVRDAGPTGDSYFNKMRKKRQTRNNSSSSSSRTSSNAGSNAKSDTGRYVKINHESQNNNLTFLCHCCFYI